MKFKLISLLLILCLVFSCSAFLTLAEDEDINDDIALEEKLEKEDEINNDGSLVKEFSNFDNEYFKSKKNLALNAEVKAFGYDINQVGGVDSRFPRENITDGDTETKFGTYKSALTGYVTIKLSEKRQFNKIVISESSLSLREYTIYTSNDGISWNKLIDVEGMNGIKEDVKYYFDKNKTRDLTWQNIMDVENTISNLYSIHYFDEVEAKYIKIDITKIANQQSNTAWGFYINEIGVYNESEIDYQRFDIAYKKATDYYNQVAENPESYNKEKLEKLKNLLETYKDIKSGNYTQPQLEDITDSLVIARVDLYRSRKFDDSHYQKIIDNIIARLNVNREYTEKEDIDVRANDANGGKRASDSMLYTDNSLLWEDFGTFENAKYTQTPVTIQKTYTRIRQMSMAATGKYSPYRGDEALLANIRYALKKADEYWYNPDIPWFDSSMWSQMLGTPPIYSDILVMLKGYIPDSELQYYARRLSEQMKNDYMNWSGVNRMNIALANAKVGVILKEYWRIDNLRVSVEEEFAYVDKTEANANFYVGNGYYSDGTFIYHNDTPYNGGYGQDGMAYNANGIIALNDTPWELPNEKLISYFVDIIKEGYDPIVINGHSMSMMMGRNITRNHMERKKACELANTISMVLDIIEEPYQGEFKSMIKSWFQEGTDWKQSVNSDVKAILRDDSIPVREDIYLNKVYHYGDRVVHRRGNWSFGISMSSSRIKMYEGINNENKKGWYTGSGVTFIYNDDFNHYNDDYWFTVDMYRLPGTTVDTAPRQAIRYQGEVVTPYDSVGGASLNNEYGIAQMEAYQWESDLKARKSWFMFDNEVVCLGSGITSYSDNQVETTVENRMIDDSSVLTVNGAVVSDAKAKISSVKTAHLIGRKDAQTGFYFPDKTELNILKDTRTHKFSEVTASDLGRDTDGATRTFSTMYINHGKSPENSKYSYVLLPDMTKEQTEAYSNAPEIEIIANNEYCHAVKDKNLGITGINLFEDKKIVVDGVHITQKSAVVISEKDEIFELSLSDTTQKNDGIITITLNRQGKEIISKDDNVNVNFDGNKIYLKLDMKAVKGECVNVKLKISEKTSLFPSFQVIANAETLTNEDFEDVSIEEETKIFGNENVGKINISSASTIAKTSDEIINTGSSEITLRDTSSAELVDGFTKPVHKTDDGAVTDSTKADYYKLDNLTSYFKLFTDNGSAHFYYYDIPSYMKDGLYFRLNKGWAGTRNNLSFPTQNPETTEALTFKINKSATVYYIYQGASASGVATNAKWLGSNSWTKCDETVSYVNGTTGAVSNYLIYKKVFNVSDGETCEVKIGGQKGCYLPPQVFVVWNEPNDDSLYAEVKSEESNKYLTLNTKKSIPDGVNPPELLTIKSEEFNISEDKPYYQIDLKLRFKDCDTLRELNLFGINNGTYENTDIPISFNEDKTITLGKEKTQLGTYNLDKWHKLTLAVDMNESTLNLFFDNKKLTSDAVILNDYINLITFSQVTKKTDDTDAFYEVNIDDFLVKTQNTPNVTSVSLSNTDRKPVVPEFDLIFGNDMLIDIYDKIIIRKSGITDGSSYIKPTIKTNDFINFTITPANDLMMDTDYEVAILDAKDIYGNIYAEVFSFKTVEADYDAQIADAIDDALKDIPQYVTKDLLLPAVGLYDVDLIWEFKPEEVITNKGKVTRDDNEYQVTVKLTGEKKGRDDSIEKTIVVPKLNATSNMPVISNIENGGFITDDIPDTCWEIPSDKENGEFTVNFSDKCDFNKVEFKISASEDTVYTIKDADTNEIIKSGTIENELTEETLLINSEAYSVKNLKVSFNKNKVKVYSMFVYSDAQADIDLDAKELSLGDISSVTSDLEFNFKGARNTKISWKSSNTQIIANDGTVVRPLNQDAIVTVTATVTKQDMTNLIEKEKVFSITVKKRNIVKPGASGGGGGGGGSFVAPSNPKPAQPETTEPDITQKEEIKQIVFNDVSEDHWANHYITILANKGIVNGMTETEFAPDENVTREQFVKMLVLSSGLTGNTTELNFTDVNKNDWYYETLNIAYSNGIISGYDGKAGVGENITRQDMAVMVARVIDKLKINLIKEGATPNFKDKGSISSYASSSVELLCEMGILSGYEDGEFKPSKTLTRAECAKIIYEIYIGINGKI